MNIDQDYDNDGNNIVPCPICLSVHCPSKEDGKCPKEDEFIADHTPPSIESIDQAYLAYFHACEMGDKNAEELHDKAFEMLSTYRTEAIDEGVQQSRNTLLELADGWRREGYPEHAKWIAEVIVPALDAK